MIRLLLARRGNVLVTFGLLTALAVQLLIPVGALAAPGPADINSEPFRLSGSYAEPGGQPTGAGSFANGEVSGYPEGACVPIHLTVRNDENAPATQDVTVTVVYDYVNGSGVVGFEDLEMVVPENPPFISPLLYGLIDNLNDLEFPGTALTGMTSAPWVRGLTTGSIAVSVTGPFSGDTGTAAPTPTDAERHYTIVLEDLPRRLVSNTIAHLYFCGRLGDEAGDYADDSSLSIRIPVGSENISFDVAGDVDPVDPVLTVTKLVVNDDGGRAAVGDFPLFVTPTGGAAVPVTSGAANTFAPGTYRVSETALAGYAGTIGGDCAADGSITMVSDATYACTITNDDVAVPTGDVTVTKVVVNDNGGTATVGDFPLTLTNTGTAEVYPISSGVTASVPEGTYVVGESGPGGYGQDLGACGGTITVTAGDPVTCTVTNDDIPPQLTVVKTVVNDDGGSDAAGDFTMFVLGTNVSDPSFPGDAAGTTITLDAGRYAVDEEDDRGYAKTLGADCSGTIGIGESRTCTITNNDRPLACTESGNLLVNGGFESPDVTAPEGWEIYGAGGVPGWSAEWVAGQPTSFEGVDRPEPAISELDENVSGWLAAEGDQFTELDTDWVGPGGALNGEPALIRLYQDVSTVAGRDYTLTFQYSPRPSQPAEENAFHVEIDGVAQPGIAPGAGGGANSWTTGTVTFTGTGASMRIAFVGEGPGNSLGVFLDDVQLTEETCPPSPSIRLVKQVVNDDGGTATVLDFPLFLNASPVTSGAANTVAAGSFVASETGMAGYTATFSGDCDATGAMTVPADTDVDLTCTITNDDDEGTPTTGTLVVQKVVVGGSAAVGDFPLFVDGSPVTSGASNTVSAGVHTVTETGMNDYDASWSNECPGGVATVPAGETVTCTLTNTYDGGGGGNPGGTPATLTVIKTVVNDDGGTADADDFAFTVTGSAVSPAAFNGSATGTVVSLAAGSYAVTEAAADGYAVTYSAGCSGTIASGESRTCTVTNDDLAEGEGLLTVIVVVVNDDGDGKTPSHFTENVTGQHPRIGGGELEMASSHASATVTFSGSGTGTAVTLGSGAYAVTQVPDSAYTTTYSAGCAGTIAAGMSLVCIVTNDDTAGPGGGSGGSGSSGGSSGGSSPTPAGGSGGAATPPPPAVLGDSDSVPPPTAPPPPAVLGDATSAPVALPRTGVDPRALAGLVLCAAAAVLGRRFRA